MAHRIASHRITSLLRVQQPGLPRTETETKTEKITTVTACAAKVQLCVIISSMWHDSSECHKTATQQPSRRTSIRAIPWA